MVAIEGLEWVDVVRKVQVQVQVQVRVFCPHAWNGSHEDRTHSE